MTALAEAAKQLEECGLVIRRKRMFAAQSWRRWPELEMQVRAGWFRPVLHDAQLSVPTCGCAVLSLWLHAVEANIQQVSNPAFQ